MSPTVLSVLPHAAALISALFGGLTFVEADLPGIQVYRGNRFLGEMEGNFRHVDIDGDGETDVLTGEYVAFQRNGLFPSDARVPLPAGMPNAEKDAAIPVCDVWGRDLFLRSQNGLRRVRWGEGEWQEVLSQTMAWPHLGPSKRAADTAARGEAGHFVELRPFLHDLDEDGIPEIAVPTEDGIHVFVLKDGAYSETAVLNVYPSMRDSSPDDACLWPPRQRRLEMPYCSMDFDVVLNAGSVTVAEREGGRKRATRVSFTRYSLDASNGFAVQSGPPRRETVILEEGLIGAKLCRLNDDDIIDMMLFREENRQLAPFMPEVTTSLKPCISTDGGTTFQEVRLPAFHWRTTFTDFERDGDSDLVVEERGIAEGGLLETVARAMTRRSFELQVRVHLQDETGTFSPVPDIRGRFTIKCEEPLDTDALEYGEVLYVHEDFDGDGRGDALVQDQPNRFALYLNQGQAFQSKPAATWVLEPEEWFDAMDVDGDGRGDVILTRRLDKDESKESASNRNRILLTREATP